MKKKKQLNQIVVRKLLLLRIGARVFVLEYENGKYEHIFFSGEDYIDFNAKFWESCRNHISWETGQNLDLCLIAEETAWELPEEWHKAQIEHNSVWNPCHIDEALQCISPNYSMDVFTNSGTPICHYSTLFPKETLVHMIAIFADSDLSVATPEPTKSEEIKMVAVAAPQNLSDNKLGGQRVSDLARYFIEKNNEDTQRGLK